MIASSADFPLCPPRRQDEDKVSGGEPDEPDEPEKDEEPEEPEEDEDEDWTFDGWLNTEY